MTVDSPTVHRGESRADILLRQVRARLGAFGSFVIVGKPSSGGVTAMQWTVTWFRDYGDVLSDKRQVSAATLAEALEAVLVWEDDADLSDAAG